MYRHCLSGGPQDKVEDELEPYCRRRLKLSLEGKGKGSC